MSGSGFFLFSRGSRFETDRVQILFRKTALWILLSTLAIARLAAAPWSTTLRPGDIVHVSVWNNLGVLEAGGECILDLSGQIMPPLLDHMIAAGMTLPALQDFLQNEYSQKLFKRPRVSVHFLQAVSPDSVLFLDEEGFSEQVFFRDSIALTDALSRISRHPRFVRGNPLGTILVKRGEQEFRIPGNSLPNAATILPGKALFPGDVVRLGPSRSMSGNTLNCALVLGAVHRPGPVFCEPGTSFTVAEIIRRAGGLKNARIVTGGLLLKDRNPGEDPTVPLHPVVLELPQLKAGKRDKMDFIEAGNVLLILSRDFSAVRADPQGLADALAPLLRQLAASPHRRDLLHSIHNRLSAQ